MRRLIADIYGLIFRLTGARMPAVVFSLLYVTALNLVMIYGLGLLLEGLFPIMSIVHKLFSFPYFIVTAVVVFAGTSSQMPSVKSMTQERKRGGSPVAILLYTIFSLMLFAYISLGDKLF
jgi:hypothetical protein